METPVLIAGAAVVLLVLAAVLVLLRRSAAESRRALATARAETAELRARLDTLSEQLERQAPALQRSDDPAYVITDAGVPEPVIEVPDRLVLSATIGEPLVKVVAFGHGMRRALSPESRNKIWFEVRREVRRARKQRRREMKEAWRERQATDRAAGVEGAGGASAPSPADAA